MSMPVPEQELPLQGPAFPLSILLVSNDANAIAVLEEVSMELKVDLVHARSEDDAVEHVTASDFALILVDLAALGADADALGSRLSERLRAKATPIIFLVDFETPRIRLDKVFTLDAVEFLTVPLIPGAVRARIQMVALHRQTVALGGSIREHKSRTSDDRDAWLRLVFDNTTDYALIVTDTDGLITHWEGVADGVVGWQADEVIGKSLALIFAPEDKAEGRLEIELALARENGRAEDKRWHIRKDGKRFFADGVMVPLLNPDNRLRGFAKIFRDVTERKLADEQLSLSNDCFSLLLESSGEGIYGMGPDSSCTFLNAAGAAMLGYHSSELVGRPIHGVIHQKHPDGSHYPVEQCHIGIAAKAGTSVRIDDEVFWHKDGHAVPVSYSVSPIIVNGKPSGAVVTYTDATQRRQAEDRLKASEERVRIATDAAELGMWSWRPSDDMVTWENDRMYEIFGLPRSAEPVNAARFLREFVHPQDAAQFTKAVKLTVESGARFHFEGRFTPTGCAEHWVEFTGLLQRASDGSPLQIVGTASDTTRRKRTEEDLRTLAAELSEANRKKGEFLATLAHELRNPLAPIRTGLMVLRLAGDNPEAAARVRDMMERQVTHMVHLVDDLLDVARISRGKVELKKARVDLKKVVSSAIETSLPQIEASHHELSVIMPDEPLLLDADATRLAQVLSNLLTNAAKYTLPGGRIKLAVNREDSEVVISVTDSGVGIPVEALSTVFEMFAQVSKHLTQAQGGLGIGLSLVRHLIELHDGKVSVYSQGEGKGSTFIVRLPLAAEGDQRIPVAVARVRSTGDQAHRRIRVLIADDNEDAGTALAEYLKIAGHTVRVVNNGNDALQTARTFRPELMLLDIGMPGLNGYEVARAVRATAGIEQTELVALTGWGTDEDRAKAVQAGFDHHLTKPASSAEIERIVEAVARGQRAGNAG